jgi:hypothetical protein
MGDAAAGAAAGACVALVVVLLLDAALTEAVVDEVLVLTCDELDAEVAAGVDELVVEPHAAAPTATPAIRTKRFAVIMFGLRSSLKTGLARAPGG